MQSNTNRILSTALVTTLSLSLLAAPVLASDFTDSDTFPSWAVPYITDAVGLGLVEGYTDGSFKPDQTMKVGEFLVMLTNSYPELKTLSQDSQADQYLEGQWYSKYVYAAHKSGLFPLGMEPTVADMSAGITREEAAYIVYQAITTIGGESNGDNTLQVVNIEDYNTISDGKREAVTQLYLFGIMSGTSVNSQGFSTFSPQNVLKRSELCVIMLALNEPERRNPYKAPDTSGSNSNAEYPDAVFNENGQQIIQAGVSYERPMAQEGDIVIGSDGKVYTLEKDPVTGVLGWGVPVAADLGLITPTGKEIADDRALYWPGATDSLGNSVTSQNYHVNQLTGEGHWACEIIAYDSTCPADTNVPAGTLTEDKNWVFNSMVWVNCFTNDITWDRIEYYKTLN